MGWINESYQFCGNQLWAEQKEAGGFILENLNLWIHLPSRSPGWSKSSSCLPPPAPPATPPHTWSVSITFLSSARRRFPRPSPVVLAEAQLVPPPPHVHRHIRVRVHKGGHHARHLDTSHDIFVNNLQSQIAKCWRFSALWGANLNILLLITTKLSSQCFRQGPKFGT